MGQIEKEVEAFCQQHIKKSQKQILSNKYSGSINNSIQRIERAQNMLSSQVKNMQAELSIQTGISNSVMHASSFILKTSMFKSLSQYTEEYKNALIEGATILDTIRQEISNETMIYQIGYIDTGRGVKTAEKKFTYDVKVLHLTHAQMMQVLSNLDYFNLAFEEISEDSSYSLEGFSTKFRTSRSGRKSLLRAMEELAGDKILTTTWSGQNKRGFTGLEFESVGRSLLKSLGWKSVKGNTSKTTSWLTTGDASANLKRLSSNDKEKLKNLFLSEYIESGNNFVFQQKNFTQIFSLLSSNSILEGLYTYWNQFNQLDQKVPKKIVDTDKGDFIGDVLRNLKQSFLSG